MKKIGYIKDNAWEAVPPWAPLSAALYIPNPGERENINAETYEQIGWVNPTDADRMGGGKLYETHSHAGPDSRPAYVVRVSVPHTEQPAPSKPSVIPLPELLSEVIEFCDTELDEFEGEIFDSEAELSCQRANVYIRELVSRLQQHAERVSSEPAMSFYDHAFIAAYTSAPSMTTVSAHAIARLLNNERTNRP